MPINKITKIVTFSVVLFLLFLVFAATSVNAGCVRNNHGRKYSDSRPGDECYSYACQSETGSCSYGTSYYSCGTDPIEGFYCYWTEYVCDYSCGTGGGGGGGGGDWCTDGVVTHACKRESHTCNRPPPPNGDQCGYANDGEKKYMCRFCATPTCTAYFDTNTNYIKVGDTINSSLTVVPGLGTVTGVDFSLQYPGNVISINTASDSASPYETSFTGISAGNAWVNASILMNGGVPRCAATAAVNVEGFANPWWQVKDSDVQSMGDLRSMVPSLAGTFFGMPGPGGFPGVSSYGGTTNLTGANVSSKGWLADSPVTNSRVYNYAYFTNQIPSDILSIINNVDIDVSGSLNTGGTPANGYYWYKYDGAMNANQPLTIPATNIGTRKVILLVDNADVNIIGNINLTDGQGFFLLIVRGSINVDPIVGGGASPNLEGLYFADNTFTDGVGNTQLTTRGSIVANGGISMQRDLGADNTSPSELFEYAPDQIMLFPKIIGTRKMEWKEVAP